LLSQAPGGSCASNAPIFDAIGQGGGELGPKRCERPPNEKQ
jgi:hypothetical protein